MPTKQATKPTAYFKRTRGGTWAIAGPTSEVKVGTVKVAKRDGEIVEVEIESTGQVFQKDGVDWCYGYKDERDN